MRQRIWRMQESNQAFQMRQNGKTYREIGEALGRSGPSVRMHLMSRGMPRRTQTSRHWTMREKALVLELRLQGETWRTIATTLGRTRDSVREAIKRPRRA